MNPALIKLADRFLPPGLHAPDHLRRLRAAILQTFLGVFFTCTFGLLYGVLGSPWSGAAIGVIAVSLVAAPWAIRRGVSTVQIGNVTIGLTAIATVVVASRSGGFTSPAISWCYLLPLTTYVACGQREALGWAIVASLEIAFFFGAELLGVGFAQDFSPRLLSLLRVSSYAGVIAATVLVLYVVESVRLASLRAIELANQTLERERILGDMHDGVGSQLLGLVLQAKSGAMDTQRLVTGLESCLDDLRLIVGSLDPVEMPLETAMGELRARLQPRCDAAGVELAWSFEVGRAPNWSPGATLQVLRTVQELVSNALRHSQAHRIELAGSVTEGAPPMLHLEVRDDGVGFDWQRPPHAGRGLKSLRARARKLAGQLEFSAAEPGTRAQLRCPVEPLAEPPSPAIL